MEFIWVGGWVGGWVGRTGKEGGLVPLAAGAVVELKVGFSL